jgi:hypothetical protein
MVYYWVCAMFHVTRLYVDFVRHCKCRAGRRIVVMFYYKFGAVLRDVGLYFTSRDGHARPTSTHPFTNTSHYLATIFSPTPRTSSSFPRHISAIPENESTRPILVIFNRFSTRPCGNTKMRTGTKLENVFK